MRDAPDSMSGRYGTVCGSAAGSSITSQAMSSAAERADPAETRACRQAAAAVAVLDRDRRGWHTDKVHDVVLDVVLADRRQ